MEAFFAFHGHFDVINIEDLDLILCGCTCEYNCFHGCYCGDILHIMNITICGILLKKINLNFR
jgi:hypothetical protein